MIGRVLGHSFYGLLVAVWVFAALCISARAAYAYVDPGSGLFFLQIIGSTVLGFTFLIRRRVAQFLHLFTRNRKVTDTDIGSR
jgi:hypothetical protein